jgi:maltooligosyltrehalose trehalohydrolase
MHLKGQVLYEMHVGTFTPEGTFDSAAKRLSALKRLGITALEIMPLHEWAGRWNWGYDGVNPFAPAHVYGDYNAFKRFVNQAHHIGLGVILDVVYNHMGPDGCYLNCYSPYYFSRRHSTDWGQALNFDGPHANPVRQFVLENAAYWMSEFHLDGLRFDATQNIYDDNHPHILAELSLCARQAAQGRDVILIAENEPQDNRIFKLIEEGGFHFDAVWADDFHHAALVALTGKNEAYYSDFQGSAQEIVSAAKRGFIYQGQFSRWQKQPRGTPPKKTSAPSFVFYTQNHDQVANSLTGERLSTLVSNASYRALTALHLLLPTTPLLFMGQEYGEESPFVFFSDIDKTLQPSVWAGRRKFLAQFPSYATPEAQKRITNPAHPQAFWNSQLKRRKSKPHQAMLTFHRDLLTLRKKDGVISQADFSTIDGAVSSPSAMVLRFFGSREQERLLMVNWGEAFPLSFAEPLFASPNARPWRLLWHSEKKIYGGRGLPRDPLEDKRWPAQCAYLYGTQNS